MPLRHHFIKPLLLILAPLGLIVAFLTLSRIGFFAWQFERVEGTGQYGFIFAQGLRFDLVLLALIMIIPATLTPLFCTNLKLFKQWRRFLLGYMTLWFIFIAFMELSTPSFINQYDSRPNYIFVEYLKHYKEVGETLLAEYPLQLLLAAIIVPLASWGFIRATRRLLVLEKPIHWLPAVLLVPLLFISFVAAGRSTLDHRAVNPATVALTPDHLVNDLALSSAYTVLYSVYLSGKDEEGASLTARCRSNRRCRSCARRWGWTPPALPLQIRPRAICNGAARRATNPTTSSSCWRRVSAQSSSASSAACR